MNAAVSAARRAPATTPGALAAAVLLLWLGTAAGFAARGTFVAPPGEVPLALMAAIGLPLALFLLAYRGSRAFRAFVLTVDLPLLVAAQGWRFLGLGFVALHVHGVLPGLFAWPAGLGDVTVALAAPWILLGLLRRPGYLTSRAFAAWNWLGIADLALAITLGALASGLVPSLAAGAVTTTPMAQLPLSLVPTFLVPLMVLLHVTGLLQARAATAPTA